MAALLNRSSVEIDEDAVAKAITEHIVLVTGAGGSIGSELCRQLDKYNPKRLVLLDRAEDNLFRIHQALPTAIPVIADVADKPRLEQVFYEHKPMVVFHAAAYKHVPMMELCPAEAVRNNTHGTRVLADTASLFDVARFVFISTDKAVNPTSAMGASKALAERYVRALAARPSTTRWVIVRFGNVLGSTGSVVPIFLEQIARGGPVTVTHPEMMRFFMTIPEATRLVMQATTMGVGGETFVLDMGRPLGVLDLARELIRRAGRDIPIVFTGIRPGEKLVEELSREGLSPSGHPGILVTRPLADPLEEVVQLINDLLAARDVRSRLLELCEHVFEEEEEEEA